MPKLDLSEHPHQRYNALTGEWILVSPHRAKRPWQGHVEEIPAPMRPQYDPACYLCPGNARAGDQVNPQYKFTFVFDNDFSALHLDAPKTRINKAGLVVARGESGVCRVICFSPRHDLTLAEMDTKDIRKVVDVWTQEYQSLGARRYIHYVQIFENKGEIMGCSNPHPHGQIWAQDSIPVEPAKELRQAKRYRALHKRCLLCDYVKLELRMKERIVCENDGFIVVVPFWAVWPFEVLVVSRRHLANMTGMEEGERDALAEILKCVTTRYDNLFNVSFPYSAGLHQSPTDGVKHPEWHFHIHFYPPLLRSATVRKFMVGYEMLANPQRDITPELSATRLRELSDVHYKHG